MTQILVTKPGTLTRADKTKLRANNVVCVEAEHPEDVRLVGTDGPPLDGNDLFFAAMSAITKDKYVDNTQAVFARAIHTLLVDLRAQRDAAE